MEKRTSEPLLSSWCLPVPDCEAAVKQQQQNGPTCSFSTAWYCPRISRSWDSVLAEGRVSVAVGLLSCVDGETLSLLPRCHNHVRPSNCCCNEARKEELDQTRNELLTNRVDRRTDQMVRQLGLRSTFLDSQNNLRDRGDTKYRRARMKTLLITIKRSIFTFTSYCWRPPKYSNINWIEMLSKALLSGLLFS